ncbi:MAG: hypothetical protein Aurels2KO_44960 [Aureliella sp.]
MNTTFLGSTTDTPSAVVLPTGTAARTYATTEAQLEVWLSSQQSEESNCAYNEISSLEFHGLLNHDALKDAIQQVLQRHAALRSTFSEDGSRVLVHSNPEIDLKLHDWSTDPHSDTAARHKEVVELEGRLPMNLVDGPLIRFVLQRLSGDHHILTFTAHHIVMDGWSLAVFCRDLGHFYDQACGRAPSPLPPANDYEQYAEAMESYAQSQQYSKDEAYWREAFSDSIPVLDTPTQMPRRSPRTYASRRYEHVFAPELVEQIRRIGAKQGCSLFNTFFAAFSAYAGRISGCEEFSIGVPTAGQAVMEQPELVGFCVNTLPVRMDVDASTPFVDYVKQARSTLLNAFEHQRMSFGTLLRLLAPPRDPSRPPMVNVSLNIDPVVDVSEIGFADLDVSVRVEPRCFENFEWFINGVIQKDKSIELQVQYNSDLYTSESMRFYFEGFAAMLAGIAQDPDQPIGSYNLMSIDQRRQLIVDFNATHLDYPIDATLHEQFTRQATETPQKVAIEFGTRSLTYEEVEKRSNRLARFLIQKGVQVGDLVGVCVPRNEHMLVNLLGVLKSGAGYVPLDPGYPSDRLEYMCEHSGLKLVVTESSLHEKVAEFGKPQLAVDTCDQQISALDDGPLDRRSGPHDICYVIYTSGSTGKPKGVQVPHGAVVNFLVSMQQEPGFSADDSVLAVTTISFDIAVLELYLPTISGGRVVIVDGPTASDGPKLIQSLEDHDISVLQATPATWRLLIQSGWQGRSNLKALCGGEPMPQDIVNPLLDRCGELWNMYGPTETTVWSAVYQITDAEAPILIGKPIGNTQIYILDENGREVPVGCEGELHIGGAGVTLGYRNRDDLTEERFVENPYRNPHSSYVSRRLYKTGDVAKIRFDGNIEFLRRNDKQVKVRGFRIELGEIELNLKTHEAISQAVVIVREDTPGDARLVAYVVENEGLAAQASDLRDHLRKSVPSYMVPQHFVNLDEMPQTKNGKIDYKQLPLPSDEVSTGSVEPRELPKTAAEQYMRELCIEHLDHQDVFMDDTFFDIGGHSLLVMQIITRIDNEAGIRLGPQDFLVNTLRQLAGKLGDSEKFASGQDTLETIAITQENDALPRTSATNSQEPAEAAATDKQVGASDSGLMGKLTRFWN